MAKNQVMWVWWADPLGHNLDQVGEPNYKTIEKHFKEMGDYEPEDTVDEKFQPIGPFKIANTPFGLATVGYSNSPDTNFIRWVGHTNFDISPEMVDAMEKVPGVEGLKIFSRYRFLLMIGLCGFSQTKVKNDVQNVMLKYANSQEEDKYAMLKYEDREKVKLLREQLRGKGWTHCAILLFYNGEVAAVYSKDKNDPDYVEQKNLLVTTYSKVGGFLFEEEDED